MPSWLDDDQLAAQNARRRDDREKAGPANVVIEIGQRTRKKPDEADDQHYREDGKGRNIDVKQDERDRPHAEKIGGDRSNARSHHQRKVAGKEVGDGGEQFVG